MNTQMWLHPFTNKQLRILKEELKGFPNLFDLIDSKSIEINMLNSYKEQIVVSYKFFMEAFKETLNGRMLI